MRMRVIAILVGAVVVVAAGGYAAFERYKLYIPWLVATLTDPVQPTHPVVWERGPDVAAIPVSQRPPNIVVILADDLGFNDISLLGGGVANGAVPTPRINSIAEDGARFVNGYAAHGTCSPSRAALMTGRVPSRFGFEFTSAPVIFARNIFEVLSRKETPAPLLYFADREAAMPPLSTLGLPLTETTIADMLKGQGYRTLMLGKWHLGDDVALLPKARGFDEWVGFTYGAALFAEEDDPNIVNAKLPWDPIDEFIWANLRFAVREDDGPSFTPSAYMTDFLAEEAAKAIEANRNRPFFLYVAFNAPHTPIQALKSDYDALAGIEDHTLRTYAAMIRALDRGVGRVLDALKAQGLDENTIVIFTSDNGGAPYVGLTELNKPYRGWKATFFEGGIHVPFFIKWPARIAAGTVAEGPAGHWDVFATAAAASGATLPPGRTIDGVDLISALETNRALTSRSLFWKASGYRVWLKEGWKLQVDDRRQRVWLYNLAADPTEQNNLAAAEPARVAAMRAELDAFQKTQTAEPLWPALIEAPIRIDHPQNYPLSPDDDYVYWAN